MNRNLVIIAIISAGIATRFIPHLPNFTAVGAIALFSGAYFSSKRISLLVPIAVLFISDLIFQIIQPGLGFYKYQIFTYLGFISIIMIGWLLRNNKPAIGVATASLGSSIAFFLISNLGSWLTLSFYPKTLGGLITCYGAAIPFFHWNVLGDLFYNAIFFTAAYFLSQRFHILRLQESKS